jgi:hypothetical protein
MASIPNASNTAPSYSAVDKWSDYVKKTDEKLCSNCEEYLEYLSG